MESILFMQAATPVQTHQAAEEFGKLDPYGAGMTVIAMAVVFFALIFLYFFFKGLGRLFTRELKRPSLKIGKISKDGQAPTASEDISGDEIAAIALALYLHRAQLQDIDETILTIRKVTRNYSPWSSKIYGLRHNPRY